MKWKNFSYRNIVVLHSSSVCILEDIVTKEEKWTLNDLAEIEIRRIANNSGAIMEEIHYCYRQKIRSIHLLKLLAISLYEHAAEANLNLIQTLQNINVVNIIVIILNLTLEPSHFDQLCTILSYITGHLIETKNSLTSIVDIIFSCHNIINRRLRGSSTWNIFCRCCV